MNREEAKIILSALHTSEGETPNRVVAEALQMAETDEVLGKWFADMQEFDQIVTERLHATPVPTDLKSDILAGIEDSQKPRWNRRFIITAFASAALVIIGLVFWSGMNSSQPQIANEFQQDMIKKIEELAALDFKSDDSADVTDYLKSRKMLHNLDIPSLVGNGKLTGCKIVNWKHHQVSLICFRIPGNKGFQSLHLMTIDASAIGRLHDREETRMDVGEWSSTVWKSGNKVYLVAMKHSGDRNLRDLLPLG